MHKDFNHELPVLFCFFNRQDVALKSFERIRMFQPKYLYLASDGAREGVSHEKEKVETIRNTILELIDWDCQVSTLFREDNLGCGLGIYSAISWFFTHVECGVILEDDCVVEDSFFRFMYEMLQCYKDDTRIGMIAGTNPIKMTTNQSSYVFSKYKSCWGWGTWKRAWKNMDIDMSWRNVDAQSVLANCGYFGKDIAGWKFKIKCIEKQDVSAWDWQWYFSLAAQNQLCVYPRVNLVSNIGADADATHTGLGNITLQSYELDFPLKHPTYILPNIDFDKEFYCDSNTLWIRIMRLIPSTLKKRVKKVLFRIINK